MSGPKCYSVSVFDKQLKQMFLFQSEILGLWDVLGLKKLRDNKLGIAKDCETFLKNNRKNLDEFLHPFSPTENETLSQAQFNQFYNVIHPLIDRMLIFKNQLIEEIHSFEKIENAYQEYLNLANHLEKLNLDFQLLKEDFIGQLKQNLWDINDVEWLIVEVKKAGLTVGLPVFDESFVETATEWKSTFDQNFEEQKKYLNQLIRKNTVAHGTKQGKTTVLLTSDMTPPAGKSNEQTNPGVLVEKIRHAIHEIDDSNQLAVFKQQFAQLLGSHNKKDVYFFSEFFEEIRQWQKQSELRKTLKEMTTTINEANFCAEQEVTVEKLNNRISVTLKRDRIKPTEVECLYRNLEKLQTGQRLIQQRKFAEQQESHFIKTRLISELTELGYEAMTDMNVVDFENSNSFLLRTPQHQNYINLRFGKQGELLYNFLIPENREDLTHEQTQLRMAEMQQTCNEFKLMLVSLKKQGLNINLEKEIEATDKALIQLPARFAGFKTKTKTASRSTAEKKKYLK